MSGHGMKRPLSLDFNQAKRNIDMGPLLSSPDLHLLKVGTPELEKIILDNPIQNTPTPSQGGGGLLFPRSATEEQEQFSAGFEVALNNLHNSHSQDSNTSVFTDLETHSNSYDVPGIKEEPQIVPSGNTPPMSPVDMKFQELMKLERKRMRNRLAASKCRSRKLERISKLQDKVKVLKGENSELATLVTQMREHVNGLKVEVLDHVNNGCQIVV